MKILHVLALVLLVAGLMTAACASDFNFGGYARSIAMGGAGLALSDVAADAVLTNPAAGAASSAKLQFMFPSVDFNTTGTSISELRSRTDEISDTDQASAIALAEDFGSHETKLTAAFTTGIAGPLSIIASGEAQGIISPGPNFRAWVNAGHPITEAGLVAKGLLGDDESVYDYAMTLNDGTVVGGLLVYSTPSIAYGTKLKTKQGKLWVGGNAKFMHSEVRLWDIVVAENGDGEVGLAAHEQPRLKDNGLGMDVGFIWQPEKTKWQYGMVIDNFADPNLRGIETPMMLSVGAACRSSKLTYAIDLINLNSAGDQGAWLRTGVEWQPISKIALRAGYSGKSFTCGFGLIGLNFAFTGGDAPNMISKTLTF